MSFEVAIITAPRRVSLLGQSLDSYFQEFSVRPHVYAEPGAPHYFHESKTIRHDSKIHRGVFGNWRWALESSVADFLLICEDDILWMPGSGHALRMAMAAHKEYRFFGDKLGFLSPYCSKVNVHPDVDEAQWHKPTLGTQGWCGALALAIPYEARFALCHDPEFQGTRQLDVTIGRRLTAMGFTLYAHMPTLVRHLGAEHSTLTSRHLNHVSRQPCTHLGPQD